MQLPRSSLQPSKVEQEVGDEVVVVDNDDNSGIIPIATSPSIHLHSRSLPVVRPLINIAVHSYINCISEWILLGGTVVARHNNNWRHQWGAEVHRGSFLCWEEEEEEENVTDPRWEKERRRAMEEDNELGANSIFTSWTTVYLSVGQTTNPSIDTSREQFKLRSRNGNCGKFEWIANSIRNRFWDFTEIGVWLKFNFIGSDLVITNRIIKLIDFVFDL